jgi:predicted AlkP superfamily phosphohydrolase/phosphomutase
MSPTESRVVLFGLDGAGFPILDPMLRDGTMPNLAAVLDAGVAAPLRSTEHPLSPPAWASIMTGRPPGEHGIFDFVRLDHSGGTPAYTLISSADLRVPTVFDIASRHGRRVTALNFPCMFPPPALNGSVVPGYVPWSYLGRACHPRGLFRTLKEQARIEPRKLAVDWELERTAIQGLPADQLSRWVRLHVEREEQWGRILLHLMRSEPSDLTAVVLDGVDRIQHLCLHLLVAEPEDLTPEERDVRSACRDYFRVADGLLGEVLAAAGPDADLLVVSDHGAQLAGDRIFYANTWLAQHGLLTWHDDVAVDDASRVAMNGNTESTQLFDWDHTSAAALTSSSNAIVVHRATHRGLPGVPPEEYEAFCRRLREDLLTARDPATGERIVARVLLRDEAFPGPAAEGAPDLTLELRSPGFLSVLRGPDVMAARVRPYGTHHRDGVFIAYGPGIAPGTVLRPLSVVDVAATVLHLLGLPIPAGVAGQPAVDGMRPAVRAPRPDEEQRADVLTAVGVPPKGLDAAGEAEIVSRLRSLGYLE